MITVTEFVSARLDEDEAYARAQRLRQFAPIVDEMARPDTPARVLAQCAAMRSVMERHTACDDTSFGQPCEDLRAFASIWSDHADWREEWR